MGNRNDGSLPHQSAEQPKHKGTIVTHGEDGVEVYGNEDAKKLTKAYKDLSRDGLSKEERQKLEKLDEVLKGADYHCMATNVTLVTQQEHGVETNFVVLGNGLKQDSGFIKKPGREK